MAVTEAIRYERERVWVNRGNLPDLQRGVIRLHFRLPDYFPSSISDATSDLARNFMLSQDKKETRLAKGIGCPTCDLAKELVDGKVPEIMGIFGVGGGEGGNEFLLYVERCPALAYLFKLVAAGEIGGSDASDMTQQKATCFDQQTGEL